MNQPKNGPLENKFTISRNEIRSYHTKLSVFSVDGLKDVSVFFFYSISLMCF